MPTGSTWTTAKTRSRPATSADSAKRFGTPRRNTLPSYSDWACCGTLNFHPNHVYLTQCLPGLLADRTSGPPGTQTIHGQLICPSIPEARALILKDYENLFADLARSGVQLDALMSCPYDYGGCRCAKCDPWILTHAKLRHEIYQLGQKYYPHVKMHMMGWWLKPEEHRMLADWVDSHAPGWIDLMLVSVPYNQNKVPDVPLPKGCRRGAFLHISYAEEVSGANKDIYAHFGPVIAADRIQQTVVNMKAQGVVGFSAYSEGVFDDVNKALLAGLSSGQYATADEVLAAYARRYFGVDEDTAKQWATWLRPWGKPFNIDVRQSAATLEMLLKKTPNDGWRLRQWVLKQQLIAANQEIEAGKEWTPERLEAVDRFLAILEKLDRGVYGLPPMRHILGQRYTPTSWYKSWAEFKAKKARIRRQGLVRGNQGSKDPVAVPRPFRRLPNTLSYNRWLPSVISCLLKKAPPAGFPAVKPCPCPAGWAVIRLIVVGGNVCFHFPEGGSHEELCPGGGSHDDCGDRGRMDGF